ncbi:MAG: STAS domain-containing protein [Gemmataceae bacterium]
MPKLVHHHGALVVEMPANRTLDEQLLAHIDDVLVESVNQSSQVVVDLTASPHLPGSVLGVLVRHFKRVRQCGGRMVVVSTPLQRELFEVSQLERLVTLTSSRDEALAVLAASA